MLLSDLPVFFLDLQTTGSQPPAAHILEMAWADSYSLQQSYLVSQTGNVIPTFIQRLTGLKNSDLASSLPLEEVLNQFSNFLSQFETKPWAVIHYAQFEKPFLKEAFGRIFEKEIPFEILCTHEIAKRLFPNLPTRGIKGLGGYFGQTGDELKRSTEHVGVTKIIWRGLVQALKEKDILTLEQLLEWMTQTPKAKRTKYEYPLAKEKRLRLCDDPGIYRMLSRNGEVLYVGKATCLHSRVNSYFRGQKNRDAKKLEMLTQVWDLDVTPCQSPLEAALLETDEIKRLNPKYNISLKVNGRELAFYSKDFLSLSSAQDEIHSLGPFSSRFVLEPMIRLSQALQNSPEHIHLPSTLFFDPIESEILNEGFKNFCSEINQTPENFVAVRSILALGLSWCRQIHSQLPAESEIEEADDVNDEILTAKDVAEKFKRHFLRAALSYWRSRKLTRLLNSDIHFQAGVRGSQRDLYVRQGLVFNEAALLKKDEGRGSLTWQSLSTKDAGGLIETYDRMSVLYSELEKLKTQGQKVIVSTKDSTLTSI